MIDDFKFNTIIFVQSFIIRCVVSEYLGHLYTSVKFSRLVLPIIIHNSIEPVCNGENCAVSELAPNRLLNEIISFQIHRGCGFIKNKDLTVTQQRTC